MKTPTLLAVILTLAGLLSAACAEPDGFHYASQPTMSADLSQVIASVNVGGTPAIYDLSLRGEAPKRLTEGPDVSPAVSPDGNTIVFARQQPNKLQSLYVLSRTTDSIRPLTEATNHDDYPVFIDARSVVFLRAGRLRNTSTGGQRWIDWDLFVVGLDTGVVRRVTASAYWEATPPSVTDRGASVLLTAGTVDEPRRPFVVNLSNGDTKSVGLVDDGPVSAIDEKSMVVLRQTGVDPRTDLYVYNLFQSTFDGSQRRQLTDLNTYCERPNYQRDIGLLLFLTDNSRSGPSELWQMSLAGKPARVTVRLP